jgi:hypothetical protein
MKNSWTLLFILCVSACQSVPTQVLSTETPTLAPPPTQTVEWFPPTPIPEKTPTSAVLPTQAVSVELGEVIFRDKFNAPSEWTLPQTDRGAISFSNGEANIIINQSKSFLVGTREKPDLQNFYAEITAKPILCSGRDEYGLLFRVLGRNQYYRYAITCSGEVRLDKITSEGGSILYPSARSASVPVGAPSVLKLAVVADWDQLHLFINGDYQTTITDQQLQVGSFGIFARSSGDTAVTISFSDLIVREIIPK